jgi:hypothetical protein
MKQYLDTPYFVSEDGGIFRDGKELNPGCNPKGYPQLSLSYNGVRATISIHRIMAICYVPNPENKPQVNHIDGDKLNNHYTNLEWVTNQENCDHRDNVLDKKNTGEKCGKSILKTEDVLFIRKNYISRHPIFGTTPLSKKFNVASRTILSIVKNERWKHLPLRNTR